jgi:hypothetical protein
LLNVIVETSILKVFYHILMLVSVRRTLEAVSKSQDKMITRCGRSQGDCVTMSGEHKVHPYGNRETLCRGEPCVRPHRVTALFPHCDTASRIRPYKRFHAVSDFPEVLSVLSVPYVPSVPSEFFEKSGTASLKQQHRTNSYRILNNTTECDNITWSEDESLARTINVFSFED